MNYVSRYKVNPAIGTQVIPVSEDLQRRGFHSPHSIPRTYPEHGMLLFYSCEVMSAIFVL
jgi:hypothetical protein